MIEPEPKLVSLPIFEICGETDSERTALVNALVKELGRQGLRAKVIDGVRFVGSEYASIIEEEMTKFPCDLFLVNGASGRELPTLFLEEGTSPSRKEGSVLLSFGREGRLKTMLSFLVERIAVTWRQAPVWAGVLIGGRSSRMGQPKHLLKDSRGITWLARTIGILEPFVNGIVILGSGDIPADMKGIPRRSDLPGLVGPLAGMLSAMRWQTGVSWLFVACDMPDIMEEALQWLLAGRRPGVWGVLPRKQKGGPVEPLLAQYDFRSRYLFEDLARRGCLRINALAENPKIDTPLIPSHLLPSWRNVNSPEDLLPKDWCLFKPHLS